MLARRGLPIVRPEEPLPELAWLNKFAGGGMWEAMHGDMRGWYEARKDFQRRHYRLFCLLDTKARSRAKPLLVVVDGRDKARGTVIDDKEYKKIRALGERYRKTQPRPIA